MLVSVRLGTELCLYSTGGKNYCILPLLPGYLRQICKRYEKSLEVW